jgi:hypothetical protein
MPDWTMLLLLLLLQDSLIGKERQPSAGAAFTKCFHNSSTIIPSTIIPQANRDAPNSSKRGRMRKIHQHSIAAFHR